MRNNLKPHMVRVKEGDDKDEFLIIRLDHVKPAINIVNVYGGQESRMDDQEVLENWGRIKVELDKIKERNESCVILGDFNRAIGCDKLGIPGNHPRVSFGGHLVRELLEDQEYIMLNSSQKAEGGPWTWVSRADSKIKSCIDFVIVTADLFQYVTSMVVDTEKKFAPVRVRTKKGKMRLIPPDHNPIIIKFENLPTSWIRREQVSQ